MYGAYVAVLDIITGHKTAQGAIIGVAPFSFHRQVECTQGVIAGSHEVEVIHLHINQRFALIIQGIGFGCRIFAGLEAVEYLQRSATKAYAVARVQLIIVIEIVLVRAHAELVGASLLEDRMTEQVLDGAGRVLAVQADGMALVNDTGYTQFLFAHSVLRHSVHQLYHTYLHRIAVDAVEACIIGSMAPHRVGGEHGQRRIRQVECRHARLHIQQRGISRSGGLRHFVLHGEEIHRVFTTAYVRTDNDAFLLVGDLRAIYGEMQRVLRQVIRVMHDMCGVVAFELEHELQVITEVVRTKSQSRWQGLLVQATGYATYEAHLGAVIEAYAVERFDERESRIALCDEQPSVVGEGVSRFGHLQAAGHGLGQRKLKIAVNTAGIDTPATTDRIAVEDKAYAAHGNRTHMV